MCLTGSRYAISSKFTLVCAFFFLAFFDIEMMCGIIMQHGLPHALLSFRLQDRVHVYQVLPASLADCITIEY
jgi:hypothetical protein